MIIKSSLGRGGKKYRAEIYLNRACAERRRVTPEDVKNDYKKKTFTADSDYDALIKALCLIRPSYEDEIEECLEDFPTTDSLIYYFENYDWGDGYPILVRLYTDNRSIFDSGVSKEEFLD